MKVWMIVSSGYFDDIRVRKQAHLTARSGHPVVILAMNRSGHAPNAVEGEDEPGVSVKLVGMPVRQFAGKSRKALSRLLFLSRCLWTIIRHVRKDDVVHCNDLDTAILGLPAKARGARFVLDLHEVFSGLEGLPAWMARIFRLWERLLIPSADAVVFVSESSRDFFESRMPIKSSHVVTNSRSRHEMRPIRQDASPQPGLRVVYVGRFSQGRGLDALVRSMAWLPSSFSLDLLGFGPLEAQLRDLARTLPTQGGRVVFREPVPLDAVVDEIAAYDVGVVLTQTTCLNHELTVSNKLFEYAAAGLPMLVSPVKEHLRLLDGFNFGLPVDVTPRGIADALAKMTIEDRSEMAREASRLASERCWEREFKQLLDAYGLKEPPPASLTSPD